MTWWPARSARPRLIEMQRRGRADVDDVEVELQELVVIGDPARDVVFAGGLPGPLRVDVAKRLHRIKLRQLLKGGDVIDADAGADDAHLEAPGHAARSAGRLPARRFASRLRLQRQFRRIEAMRLRHRGLGAVQHIVAQLLAIDDLRLRRVDMADAFPVGQEEVVAAGAAVDVDVFPQLKRSFRAEDEKPPVAPYRQIRRA